jgi:hypothetical protein
MPRAVLAVVKNGKIEPISPISICLIAIFNMGLFHGCVSIFDGDPCDNKELQTVNSPNGQHKAIVFQRSCGATTGFSTQISLLKTNKQLPKEGGNIFMADTNHGKAPAGDGGGPAVTIQWLGEQTLSVKYDKRSRVFRCGQSMDGVSILYNAQ